MLTYDREYDCVMWGKTYYMTLSNDPCIIMWKPLQGGKPSLGSGEHHMTLVCQEVIQLYNEALAMMGFWTSCLLGGQKRSKVFIVGACFADQPTHTRSSPTNVYSMLYAGVPYSFGWAVASCYVWCDHSNF